MKIEFITKEIALKRYKETKELAFSIAKANDTLPGYCSAPECVQHVAYAGLATHLKPNEKCLFINDLPAEMLTDFELERGKRVIGKICGENMIKAEVKEDVLYIYHADGVIEAYRYDGSISCWKYDSNNAGNIKLAQRGIN